MFKFKNSVFWLSYQGFVDVFILLILSGVCTFLIGWASEVFLYRISGLTPASPSLSDYLSSGCTLFAAGFFAMTSAAVIECGTSSE